MGKSRHTIELNGNLYDAVTGTMLAGTAPLLKKMKPSAGKVLDGFTRKPQPAKSLAVLKSLPKSATKHIQRSKTLMRSAVKKPSQQAQAAAVATTPAVSRHASSDRNNRAKDVNRSQLISKFGAHKQAAATAPAAVAVQLAQNHQPSKSLEQALAAVTTPVKSHKTGKTSSATFERALHKAQSHLQPKAEVKKVKLSHRIGRKLHVSPAIIRFGGMAAALLLIGGYVMYQSQPQLAMRVAAARAGVPASLPGYRPAGFAMSNKIEYDSGEVRVSFKSNTDDRTFQLTQKQTEWSPDQLLKEEVAVNNRPYQTYQNEGHPIYIYDGSTAAWVEDGILYQIEGSSSLTSDQLLRMATSL